MIFINKMNGIPLKLKSDIQYTAPTNKLRRLLIFVIQFKNCELNFIVFLARQVGTVGKELMVFILRP